MQMLYEYAKSSVHCPGLYCGRIRFQNGSESDCGACPRGFRSAVGKICEICVDLPQFYDWLYLGFMALLILVSEWYIIDKTLKRRSFTTEVLVLHASALVENIMAIVSTLLVTPPVGELLVHTCRVRQLSDWYTLLHNPTPGYKHTLRCTQEAVYPLYSMVFIYYGFCLVSLLLLRPVLVFRVFTGQAKKSIFLTMYIIPAMALIHATMAGLLYYSFPYITIILSVISMATHFAFRLDQSMCALLVHTVKEARNLTILLGHWFLHAYGIVAITQLQEPVLHSALLGVVPFPALFYVLTSKFTDPSKLHAE
ncbi:JNK1/MAPK8-associated membrane protein-like [Ornithodoros turicata]|uniref:JNK1/MAPK8-associated membrane protein-like n=1 Tax=Ornithodoros turicata TaxID=34597 RepID=UPI0031392C2E